MNSFIGTIAAFAFKIVPNGWAECDGSLMKISSHKDLFSVIGTTYGGDGFVTFALPDLRGRTAIGQGMLTEALKIKLGDTGKIQTPATDSPNDANYSLNKHSEFLAVNYCICIEGAYPVSHSS